MGEKADLRTELIRRLGELGVEERVFPDRDDGFSGLHRHGKPIGHFHSDTEVDLLLSPDIIRQERLTPLTDSKVHPGRSGNSPWIEIRFSTRADLDQIVRLVQLAAQKP